MKRSLSLLLATGVLAACDAPGTGTDPKNNTPVSFQRSGDPSQPATPSDPWDEPTDPADPGGSSAGPATPLPGGDPIGAGGNDLGLSVVPAECTNQAGSGAYAPGPPLKLRVCAKSFLCPTGHGLAKMQIGNDLDAAQSFYELAGTGIQLELTYAEVVTGGQPQADPLGDAQVKTLLEELRTWADIKLPGHCDLVVGYVNSITMDSGARLGGISSALDTGWHAALVTTLNVQSLPGETAAHELGHLLGLDHTHKAGGDGCDDTAYDAGCQAAGCGATCPGQPAPPAKNLMSYYHCGEASAESLTPCQVRRARCLIEHLFDTKASCPVPVLSYPDDGTTGTIGDALTLHWSLGHPELGHTLRVVGPDGAAAYEIGTALAESATIPAGKLAKAGTYTWTVSYAASCCAAGVCESVGRSFTLHPGSCSGASTQACGNCGTQTRTCQPDGSWSVWSACEAQGDCAPGTHKTCGAGDTVTCTGSCQWPACAACECGSGPCCDGCHYQPSSVVCHQDDQQTLGCPWGMGCGSDVGVEARDRYCSGATTACDGELGPPKGWTVAAACDAADTCLPGLPFCLAGQGCGCECSSGACCDGCHYKVAGTVCKAQAATELGCPWGSACGGQTGKRTQDQTCSGQSAACQGPLTAPSAWAVAASCDSTDVCSAFTGTCVASPSCDPDPPPPPPAPCTEALSAAPTWPSWTDPSGSTTIRARVRIEGDQAIVEMGKGQGGPFTASGTLLVLDGWFFPLAEVSYEAGATSVVASFDAGSFLGWYTELPVWVMAESQGGSCPGDASTKCYTATDKTGQGCGGSLCIKKSACP